MYFGEVKSDAAGKKITTLEKWWNKWKIRYFIVCSNSFSKFNLVLSYVVRLISHFITK